ncbi:hypothetical protein V1478_011966 [Vespula squamosa]|uniref:Uncharacterized protein n=1 Tax=Vespula squamosa TaxID=30214 RepID=A0ABD2AE32_VESSQ
MTERSESRNPAEDNLHCNYNEALCAAGIYGEVEGHPLTEVFTRRFEDLLSSSSCFHHRHRSLEFSTRRKGPFEWIEAPPAVLVPPEESPLVALHFKQPLLFPTNQPTNQPKKKERKKKEKEKRKEHGTHYARITFMECRTRRDGPCHYPRLNAVA